MPQENRAQEQIENELAAMRQRIDELETLHRTSVQLTSSLDLPAVLDTIAESALALVGASDCLIYLYDETSEGFDLGTTLGRWAESGAVLPPRRSGLTATVVRERKPIVIDDAVHHPLYASPEARGWNIRAIAGFPLQWGGRVLGVLHVAFVEPHTFRQEELRVLGLLADQAAVAIENSQLYARAQQEIDERRRAEEELRKHRNHLERLIRERTAALTESNAQLKQEIDERKRAQVERERLLAAERAQARRQAALSRLSAELATTLNETEVCRRVVDGLRDTLGYDFVALFLVDPASGDRVLAASVGFDEPPDRLVPGQGLSERPLLDGQLHYTPDVTQDPRYVPSLGGSEVDVPIRIAGQVSGMLVAENKQRDAFDQDDFEVLTAATQQAGLAIEKARLYKDLKASQEYARSIIDSSMDPIIAVDKERRVVEFNRAAQETFGYRPDEILGQPVDLLYADPGEGHATHRTTIEQGRYVREVMNRRKNGESFPAFLSASLLHDAQGQLVGVMGISRDITERKRAEAEFRKYQEHLEERVEERTAELRKSEERYRTLFDGVPVGLYRSTPSGEMVDANLALVEMLGYPSREDYLEVDSTSFYVNPQDRVRWQALMQREGVVRDFEAQMCKHDGTVIWVNDTARAVKDERDQVLYYEGSLEDITERKRAAEELRRYREHLEELVEERTAELRKSEERYRTLFDGVPVGLYRTTPEGQILDFNLAAVQMLGYPSREDYLEVDSTSAYVNPQDRVRWQALMQREGVVRDFEAQMCKHDGTVIWVNDTARAVKDERGQVLYYEGSLEDITERKQFEEEIRRQKDYFEALFVNSPVAVMTADLDANVVSWNPLAEQLFGYTQQEAIGRHIDELVANDPAIREEAHGYTHQLKTTGRIQATTKRTRKDGSLVDVEVLALPVIVAGEEAGYIGIYYDIGELQQARREAEAANQAKSVFLANMSHELRTPLNAILGFSQLMDGDPNLTVEQRENLAIINHSGEHLLALINDVLEMSKIEAGRVTLQETSFDLYALLDGLEEMFRLRAEEKGLTLSFRWAENVPQFVRTDEGKLRQVLSNLLGNAVKFTQEGGVALRVTALPGKLDGQVLHFAVEDTGPGIAPEELEAVFDPFVQAASGRDLVSTQSHEGTGLGLSISRQFVRLMGGDITVSSEPGQGCLFEFYVPVGLASAPEVEVFRPGRQVLGLAPDQRAPDGGPYRLLVAEDRDTNRRLLVRLLTDLGQPPLGFEVQEAANGQEAIEKWERWEPHLIWMDMRMPVMDGHEATKRIKATPKGQATAIIALTATAFEEDRERILLEGCDDFVRKPYRKDEIYDVLVRHLGVRFVYEEKPAQTAVAGPAKAAAPPGYALSAEAAAALPASWLADLQQATTKADLTLILSLVEQIREHDAALANALANLAQNYEYKKILTLIEQAGG